MLGETRALPPVHLGARVGATHADNLALYEEFGLESHEEIVGLLPPDWSFEGKRVLDFGCGAGRTLRHFLREAEVCEVYGCDIDQESIEWLQQHLCPPLRVIQNAEVPPLPLAEGSLDLIWAISVFTHLTDHWSSWLLELHRLLADDGLLIATFNGPGTIAAVADESWDADRIGMNVLLRGNSWDVGGPAVLLSQWWIEEHWGRLFDIVTFREAGFAADFWRGRKPSTWGGQGVLLAKKKPAHLSVEDLERIDGGEPREIAALRHNVQQLHRESFRARADGDQARLEAAAGTAPVEELERQLERFESSRSWRVTAPLRFVGDRARRLRRTADRVSVARRPRR